MEVNRSDALLMARGTGSPEQFACVLDLLRVSEEIIFSALAQDVRHRYEHVRGLILRRLAEEDTRGGKGKDRLSASFKSNIHPSQTQQRTDAQYNTLNNIKSLLVRTRTDKEHSRASDPSTECVTILDDISFYLRLSRRLSANKDEEARARLSEVETELGRINVQLDVDRQRRNEREREGEKIFLKQNEDMRMQVEMREEELKRVKERVKFLEERIDMFERETSDAASELNRLRATQSAMDHENRELIREAVESKAKMHLLEEKHRNTKEQNERVVQMETELVQARHNLTQLQNEKRTISEGLVEVRTDLKTSEHLMILKDKEIASLKSELSDARAQVMTVSASAKKESWMVEEQMREYFEARMTEMEEESVNHRHRKGRREESDNFMGHLESKVMQLEEEKARLILDNEDMQRKMKENRRAWKESLKEVSLKEVKIEAELNARMQELEGQMNEKKLKEDVKLRDMERKLKEKEKRLNELTAQMVILQTEATERERRMKEETIKYKEAKRRWQQDSKKYREELTPQIARLPEMEEKLKEEEKKLKRLNLKHRAETKRKDKENRREDFDREDIEFFISFFREIIFLLFGETLDVSCTDDVREMEHRILRSLEKLLHSRARLKEEVNEMQKDVEKIRAMHRTNSPQLTDLMTEFEPEDINLLLNGQIVQ
ncbi:hypothetical protein PROFUN_11584 [Planoprotostelium fungivorum]|uniref:Uncharacterized protein n=1 Tax=Planoprotostelium fungivorum TaxID=1890364 RepID=A0A2P6N9S6_9EUKA|nr:hypothetical protein PROFUN_11584 [Planoprotostelium fungivorum]